MSLLLLGDVVSDDACFTINDAAQVIISGYDNVICNLEGPLVSEVEKLRPVQKVGPNIGQDKRFIDFLVQIGVNIFAVANNHIFDFGIEPVKETLDYLVGLDCHVVGISIGGGIEPIIIKDGSDEFCILNLCETHFAKSSAGNSEQLSYASLFDFSIFHVLSQLRAENRKIIAYVHAGVEAIDVPLPFFREYYRKLIDNGVDFVICHHPHVIQGMEFYNSGRIYYSIGDFIFRQKGIKRHSNVGCGIGLKYDSGELKVFHHYFEQSEKAEIKIINEDIVLMASELLLDDVYCRKQFKKAYLNQVLPLKFFSEGKFSFKLSIRTNLSLLFRTLLMPNWSKVRKADYKLHIVLNESYRELEKYVRSLSKNNH